MSRQDVSASVPAPLGSQSLKITVVLLALLALFASPSGAQEATDGSAPANEGAPSGFLGEIVATDRFYGGKVVDLARAVPEESYGYTPSEKTRTLRQALLHVAISNFTAAAGVGATLPEDVPADVNELRAMESEELGKDRVVDLVTRSFELIREAIAGLEGMDLETGVRMNGQQTTLRGALVLYAVHHGEHLGQLIAYARAVGVKPPWSLAPE